VKVNVIVIEAEGIDVAVHRRLKGIEILTFELVLQRMGL
jgi:hypothetical protein